MFETVFEIRLGNRDQRLGGLTAVKSVFVLVAIGCVAQAEDHHHATETQADQDRHRDEEECEVHAVSMPESSKTGIRAPT